MKTIGITGEKGGTGKLTIDTALAFELAKRHKMLLMDTNVDCPNDDLLLNAKLKVFESVTQ